MKVLEAIEIADDIVRNTVSEDRKIKWLKALDGKVYLDVFDTHENITLTDNSWTKHILGDTLTDTMGDLIIEFPYDELYINYLLSKIYIEVNEVERANNAMLLFNDEYKEYKNYINRTFVPKQDNIIG